MIVIEEIIIEGFKSYNTKTKFSNFDEHFNSITGKNGSGKSNILDAICFVLGLSNLNLMRVSKLEDLIFKNKAINNKYACVTIILKKKNFLSPQIFLKDIGKFMITRKIYSGGKNRYFLNQIIAKPSHIINLLHSLNVNINNPHFLIRQGHITKIAQMKSQEIFDILINALGIKLFEIKKKKTFELIKKKNEKINKIGDILMDEIRPRLILIMKSDFYLKKLKITKNLDLKIKKSLNIINLILKKNFIYFSSGKKKVSYKSIFNWKNIDIIFFKIIFNIFKKKIFFLKYLKKYKNFLTIKNPKKLLDSITLKKILNFSKIIEKFLFLKNQKKAIGLLKKNKTNHEKNYCSFKYF